MLPYVINGFAGLVFVILLCSGAIINKYLKSKFKYDATRKHWKKKLIGSINVIAGGFFSFLALVYWGIPNKANPYLPNWIPLLSPILAVITGLLGLALLYVYLGNIKRESVEESIGDN